MDTIPPNDTTAGPLSVKYSLRSKLLALLLGVTVVVVLMIGYLSIIFIQRVGQMAQQVSSSALSAQLEKDLIELTANTARENDLVLEKVRTDAQSMARYATSIFSRPEHFAAQSYWSAAEHMFVGPDGQYINSPDDISTVFIPNSVVLTSQLLTHLELSAYLDLVFAPVYEGNDDTVAIYLISEQEISRLYPNIDLGAILPPDFLATEDIFFALGAPENNPARDTVWTPVYDDPAGQGLLVSAIAPIYLENDDFFGVIGVDVSLDKLSGRIEEKSLTSGAYSFLIDSEGRAVALPDQGYQDILGRPAQGDEFGVNLNEGTEAFTAVVAQMKEGATGFTSLEINNRELFVAYAPLEGTAWSLGTVVEADTILTSVARLQQQLADETNSLIVGRLLPIAGVVLLVVLTVGLWLAHQLVKPLQQLVVAAQDIGATNWDTPLPAAGNDEVGVLSRSLGTMSAQLGELFTTLESKVANRTRRLEIVASLSEHLTAILDFNHLLDELVNQVKESFDYYHAHVYIIDDQRHNLVMRAGTGEVGEQMKARGHIIPLDTSTSLVARAACTGEIVWIDNVREIPDWLPHELLPDTYAEMAVPIILDGQAVGVLAVQKDKVGSLDEGDANLLRSLANQVAVTIRNAQLFDETVAARQEAERANQLKTQFLSNMSHELRTPLNAIINFAGFVTDGLVGAVNKEQQDMLDKVIDGGQYLLSLINDVLDLAKIEAGFVNTIFEEVALGTILNSVMASAKGLVEDKQIEIVSHIDENLPLIVGDKRRIRQILLNLISNAVKYTVEGRIVVTVETQGDGVHITVDDTGIGIDPGDHDLVFQSFAQARHNLKHGMSTGLGLPITKQLVELHNGRIWFESEVNVGSSFHVFLPLRPHYQKGIITLDSNRGSLGISAATAVKPET